jgi:uncharacterized protein YoaH (UPF0181 family)
MIGGLFGGFAILTFIRPKTIGEAFMRGGMSVGSAIVFAQPLLEVLGLSNNWETQMMAGFCVGFLSYTVLGMIANFLRKNQNKDIVQAAKDVKDVIK